MGTSVPLTIAQINVGDSAIHLLVDDSAAKDKSTNIAEWPIIYKAILIDGGKTTGKEAIKACIERIQSSYTFAPTKAVGKLQFDSVIITHWDNDHWAGIKDLLQEDISNVLNTRDDLLNLVASSTTKNNSVKSLVSKVAGLQIPLFKYASGEPAQIFTAPPKKPPAPDPTPIAPATLLTTFYVPYIDNNRDESSFRLGPSTSDSKPKVLNSGKTWICNHDGTYTVGGVNTLGLIGYFTFKIGSGKPIKKGFKFFDVCRVIADCRDYLGVDVFFNKALPAGIYGSIKNPGQLIKAHGLTMSSGPRMYIVAGDQVILGNTPLAASATVLAPVKIPPKTNAKFHPVMKIVDEKSASLGKRYTGVRNTAESMNAPSIACLVLSSTTDAPGTIDPAKDPKESTSWKLWHFMVSR